MGIFHSLGIGFKEKEQAMLFLNKFPKFLQIDNETCFTYYNSIELEISSKNWILEIIPSVKSNEYENYNFFENPIYYLVRQYLYEKIKESEIDFEYAFWEVEAAGFLMSDDVREELVIEESRLMIIEENRTNRISKNPSFKLPEKRFLDGLIIKDDIELLPYFNFEPFKKGYLWLKF